MSTFETIGLLKVGHNLIDRDHAEFLDLLGRLDAASDAEFPALFARLYEHTDGSSREKRDVIVMQGFESKKEY